MAVVILAVVVCVLVVLLVALIPVYAVGKPGTPEGVIIVDVSAQVVGALVLVVM